MNNTLIKNDPDSFHYFQFENSNDLMKYFKIDGSADGLKLNKKMYLHELQKNHKNLLNGRTLEGVHDDFTNGYCSNSKIKNQIKTKVSNLKTFGTNSTVVRRKKRSEFDGEFNMDRVLGGEPDFFDKKTKVTKDNKIDFFIDLTVGFQFDPQEYTDILIEFIPKIIEKVNQGYLVKVQVIFSSEQTYSGTKCKNGLASVIVKNYDQYFDFERFANICEIAFFRKLMFCVLIQSGEIISAKTNSGLGYPTKKNETINRLKSLKLNSNVNLFDVKTNSLFKIDK